MSSRVSTPLDACQSGGTLVVFRKQLGDLLLLEPSMRYLQGATGQGVSVRTRPGFADMLSLMHGRVQLAESRPAQFDRVLCFDTKWSSIVDAFRVWPARRQLLRSRAESRDWRSVFFHCVVQVDGRADYRGRVFYWALAGNANGFRPPELRLPPAEWHVVDLPKRYLVVHPTAAWRRKTWPADNWVRLLSQILQRWNGQLLVTAGGERWERDMAAAVVAPFPGRARDLAGTTTLRQYMSILSRATAVLTVDGSASHLSAAFGRPTLTLFGPTNPVHWHFPTASSRRLWAGDFSREQKPPVDAIPVNVATEAAVRLLEECVDG